MDVTMFSWEFPPKITGGLGVHVNGLSKALSGAGVNPYVITNSVKGAPRKEKVDGVEVHRVHYPDSSFIDPIIFKEYLNKLGQFAEFFSDVLSYNLFAAERLDREIANNISVIHSHDWLGIGAGIMAKNALDKPLIVSIHATEQGRSGGGGVQAIKDIEMLGGKEADKIITVSEFMKEHLKDLGYPQNKIEVIYNGIDVDKYRPTDGNGARKKYGLKDDPVIFFVGRLDAVKGIDLLVEAMPHVIRSVPGAKLVILGVGTFEYELRKLVKRLKLENNVIFINKFISEKERIDLFSGADVSCFPSRYEPFGIVALESMALKTPVVASKDFGFAESVVNGETGFLVSLDPEEIAEAIITVLEEKTLSKKMGEAGRQRTEKEFTWEKIATDTKKLYKKVMG